MIDEPQLSKSVPGGHALTDADHGFVLFCNGSIRIPAGLSGGFYCTLINATDSPVSLTVAGGSLRSANASTALTSSWQSCVIFKPAAGSDVFALGMP